MLVWWLDETSLPAVSRLNGLCNLHIVNVLGVVLEDEHVAPVGDDIAVEDALHSIETPGVRGVALALLQSRMKIKFRLPDLRTLELPRAELHVQVGLQVRRLILFLVINVRGIFKDVIRSLLFQ